jgi:hypothetical protein
LPAASGGSASAAAPTFGNELAKLLVVAAQSMNASPATDTSASFATQTQQEATSTSSATMQPETAVATAASAQEGPVPFASAAPQQMPVAAPPETTSSPSNASVASSLPLPPVTAAPDAPHEPVTSKSRARDTTTPRRATTNVALSAAPPEQQPATTVTEPLSAAITIAPTSTPGAPKAPQPDVEAHDAGEPPKSAARPQVAAKTADAAVARVALPVANASSPQDFQGAVPAQTSDTSSVADAALSIAPTPTHAASQAVASAGTETAVSAGARQSASPAAQIAPALVQIGHAPDGAQRLTVHLEPPDLGQVQVRIDRPADAPARVEITVEKPETLTLRDQPQLQHALDQAGVPAEGRSVTFHVAPTEPSARSEPSTAPAPGVASGGPSSDGSQNTARNGGRPEQRSGNGESVDASTPVALTSRVRGGLDITA